MNEQALEAAARAAYDYNNPHMAGKPTEAWRMYIPSIRDAITAYREASGEASVTTAALAVLKAVDFNHETKETPLKYTVPWLEIVALRKALIAAGIKTEGEYKPAIDTALEGK